MAKTGEPSPGEGERRRRLKDLLRWYREQRGLSQEELAAVVEPPLSPETVSNLERGGTRPYRHTLRSVCQALGLTETQAQEVWTAWRTIGTTGDLSVPQAPIRPTPVQVRSPTADDASSLTGREPELAPANVALPTTGTITFLFTDVEASTRAWLLDPRAMSTAMARHDELIERVVATHGGQVVRPRGEGDSRFAVFARASDAVMAACRAQLALAQQDWPVDEPPRVRMAIHTGEAELRTGDYYGPAVNHCARLRAVAHGGQVLVSAVTAELVREGLQPEVDLRDLGVHELKDLEQPERIWQVVHPDLPAEFPPLMSVSSRRSNLPVQLSSFVGRERELGQLGGLLASNRLLTLVGSGGIGKTRLALALGERTLRDYTDGVWLVELASLADAALVASAAATALALREGSGPLLEHLSEVLRDRAMLVILDNCEHLLDACAKLVDELLRSCPNIKVLATSREPIGVTGEVKWRVPSLELPDAGVPSNLDVLIDNPCVRLFVDRARAAKPQFALGSRNAAAIVQICRRLDGIPLALELAGARIDMMTAEQLAMRLDRRFQLLTGGARTALPRQQTLVATLDWSYDLLSTAERRLFERLAVFSGGWTLEGAESVCAGPGVGREDVLDLLARLTRKSLVLADEAPGGAERYALLESVREYARQKLTVRGASESTALRERHAGYYASVADRAHPESTLTEVPESAFDWSDALRRVQADYDNLRSMLAWWLESGQPTPAFRAGATLGGFWMWRGLYSEGRYWLEAFLDLDARREDNSITPWMRARAMQGAGMYASRQGNYVRARQRFEAAAAIWRAIHQSVDLAYALSWLGLTAWLTGDAAQATELLEESRRTLEVNEDEAHLSMTLRNLGMIARSQGEYARAAELFAASVVHARAIGLRGRYSVARGLCHLGRAVFLGGDSEQALRHFREGLLVMRDATLTGHTLADCLDWLAAAECGAGQLVDAARLFGAAEAQWRACGAVRYAPERPAYAADLSRVREQTDADTFAAAWAEGSAMATEQAIDYALGLLSGAYAEPALDR